MNKIFLVDADDTILNFHGVAQNALVYAFESFGLEWKEEYLAQYIKVNDSLWAALERRELTRSELMSKRFHWFLPTIGIENVDFALFNQTYLTYLSTNPRYYEGAEAFLAELRKMGRVFIVTNGTQNIQKSRFDIVDLWSKAEKVFISEEVGFDKPARGYTDYVIANIPNFDKKNCYWIGDSLSADIKAANDAGITSIWFNPKGKPGSEKATPDFIASNYEEILQFCK